DRNGGLEERWGSSLEATPTLLDDALSFPDPSARLDDLSFGRENLPAVCVEHLFRIDDRVIGHWPAASGAFRPGHGTMQREPGRLCRRQHDISDVRLACVTQSFDDFEEPRRSRDEALKSFEHGQVAFEPQFWKITHPPVDGHEGHRVDRVFPSRLTLHDKGPEHDGYVLS